jgi:hypothetical protein
MLKEQLKTGYKHIVVIEWFPVFKCPVLQLEVAESWIPGIKIIWCLRLVERLELFYRGKEKWKNYCEYQPCNKVYCV